MLTVRDHDADPPPRSPGHTSKRWCHSNPFSSPGYCTNTLRCTLSNVRAAIPSSGVLPSRKQRAPQAEAAPSPRPVPSRVVDTQHPPRAHSLKQAGRMPSTSGSDGGPRPSPRADTGCTRTRDTGGQVWPETFGATSAESGEILTSTASIDTGAEVGPRSTACLARRRRALDHNRPRCRHRPWLDVCQRKHV